MNANGVSHIDPMLLDALIDQILYPEQPTMNQQLPSEIPIGRQLLQPMQSIRVVPMTYGNRIPNQMTVVSCNQCLHRSQLRQPPTPTTSFRSNSTRSVPSTTPVSTPYIQYANYSNNNNVNYRDHVNWANCMNLNSNKNISRTCVQRIKKIQKITKITKITKIQKIQKIKICTQDIEIEKNVSILGDIKQNNNNNNNNNIIKTEIISTTTSTSSNGDGLYVKELELTLKRIKNNISNDIQPSEEDLNFVYRKKEWRYNSTNGKHECPYLCGKSVAKKNKYTHIHACRDIRSAKCSYCGKKFTSNSMCKQHMISVHINKHRPFQCILCHKAYSTKSELSRHKKKSKLHQKNILHFSFASN